MASRHLHGQIRFEPFADAQRKAMHMLFIGTFGELLQRDVPSWYAQVGRGLVVFLFTGETLSTLQDPIYQSLESWCEAPLLINTPHADLTQAIKTYDPMREYVLLVAGGKDSTTGLYAWWRVSLRRAPGIPLTVTIREWEN